MRNKKGFTLIELLVCITILGIIMAMSIPVIRNITVKNSATKYSAYLDTVVHASKLYVDSYGEDMFGRYESGCAYVTFEDLLEKKLIKDYNADGITCNTTSTFVEVTKYEDSYSYKGYLGCANKHTPNVLVYTLPTANTPNVQDPATCAGIDVSSTIGVTVAPNAYANHDKKSIDVAIKINGRMGISRDAVVKYKWSDAANDFSESGMQTAHFNIPVDPVQRVDISAGRMISVESSPISTPLGESGKVYLIVYSDNLRDLYDNYWSYNDSTFVAYGPFTIDNRPPVFDASSSVVSSNPAYNNETPKLALSVDDDVSVDSELKMCVSYNGFCSDWEAFSANKTLPTIGGFQYNGSNYKVYVSVKDVAGNVAQKEFNYKSYVLCSVTVDDGDWVGDCPVCGTNVKITQTKQKKDAHLGTACSGESREYTCSIPTCCSSTKMVCSNWSAYGACSKACAGGTMSRTRTCKNYSNYDNSFCSDVTDSSQLVQNAVCNREACAPLPYDEVIKGVTYSCDTLTGYVSSRTCTVWWNTSVADDRAFSVHVYRNASYGNGTWMLYSKFNSQSSPYCDWIVNTTCESIPVGGVFKYRYDQNDYSLVGGVATFDSIKNY